MNGSPEPPDAPAVTSASSAPPSPAAPGVPSQAAPAAPSSAAPAPTAPAAAAPAAQAPVPPPPAAQVPTPPPPSGPTSATPPPPPPGGQAARPGMRGGMHRLHRKSPFLAGLLSLMPGIGQIYVGYYALGFIHMAVFATTIGFLSSAGRFAAPRTALGMFIPALSIFLGFFVIYNIVDAVRRATLYNLAVEGVEGIELPNMNVALPRLEGSMSGGVALIAFGVLLLSNTLFGLSLDWLASWWPLGLVGLGAYLVARARQERRAADPPAGGGE